MQQAEIDLAAVLTIPAIPMTVVREIIGRENEGKFAAFMTGKTGLLAAGVYCYYLSDVLKFKRGLK